MSTLSPRDEEREFERTSPPLRRPPSRTHQFSSFSPDSDTEALLLPITFRLPSKLLARPELDLPAFLASDLRVPRLNAIHAHLWMVGRPLPPRPLHLQRLMGREIVVTESPDLHLVWTKGRIFVKPLPRYLLDEGFVRRHVEGDGELAKCARGLFYSYVALVANESDFRIARELGLLPATIHWEAWRGRVRGFWEIYAMNEGDVRGVVNERYLYGELRLSRLNAIYRWWKGQVLYGFAPETSFSLYSDFFGDNFGRLAASLVYVVIVLTAMQVGLADERLAQSTAFRQACYGFTVFAIVAPLAIAAGILAAFVIVFAAHWFRTKRDGLRRYDEMSIRFPKRTQGSGVFRADPAP